VSEAPPPTPATNPVVTGDGGWDNVAEKWDAWSPFTDAMFGAGTTALLEMLELRPGEKVLELAAGSGGLTLHLARAVGPQGNVLATDLGPKLLQLAARNARAAGLTNVTTRVMDGQSPDLPPASVDAVACRQGLMLFPEPSSALHRLIRVIRPSGRIGVTVFSSPDRNGFVSTPVSALKRWAKPPDDSTPPSHRPGPFSLGKPGQLEGLLVGAGFEDVRSRLAASSIRPASGEELMRFYREVLSGLVSDVPEPEREEAWEGIARAIAKYAAPDSNGIPCELLVVTARKPSGVVSPS
jgi:SAM-dependent methyltransferase